MVSDKSNLNSVDDIVEKKARISCVAFVVAAFFSLVALYGIFSLSLWCSIIGVVVGGISWAIAFVKACDSFGEESHRSSF